MMLCILIKSLVSRIPELKNLEDKSMVKIDAFVTALSRIHWGRLGLKLGNIFNILYRGGSWQLRG